MSNAPTFIFRTLFLYHLAEYQSGNAGTIHVHLQDRTFRISDDGRGHAIDRTINGMPYLKLVYSQLEYPFDVYQDTPLQLHTLGISLINSLCSELKVMVCKQERVYCQYYEAGQLRKEETKANEANARGTTLEGKINSELVAGEWDLQDVQEWFAKVKSINTSLRLILNDREL